MSFIENLKAAKESVVTSIKVISVEEGVRNDRLNICTSCEHLKLNICTKCGCLVHAKTWLSGAKCPIDKW